MQTVIKKTCHHETIWHILETRNVSVLVDDMAHSLTFFCLFFYCIVHGARAVRLLSGRQKKTKQKKIPSPAREESAPERRPAVSSRRFAAPLESFRERRARGGARGVPAAACRWQAGLSHLLIHSGGGGGGGREGEQHVYGGSV